MAEIKSTMEMVLERAARMSKRSTGQAGPDDLEKDGMKMAADFLSDKFSDLNQILIEQPEEQQVSVRKGMTSTLLRNITLPRDETLATRSEMAISGLQNLDHSSELNNLCQEIQQILGQYSQHKEQVKQQLDEAIRAQLQQQLAQQGQQVSDPASINPTMHPKYNEEMARALGDLNEQYNKALDERKDSIRHRLS